jgi:uncharacterized protein YaeQ
MALTATMRRFEIALSDADRGVYADLDLRAAQHPSETDRYLVARAIARCLEHGEGVDFSRGLEADDEPAVWQKNLRGEIEAWIEVGAPSIERLHKASKTGARVAVYAWKRASELARDVREGGVHRAEEVAVHGLDAAFLDRVAATLEKRNRWELSVSGGTIYLTIGGKLFESAVERA